MSSTAGLLPLALTLGLAGCAGARIEERASSPDDAAWPRLCDETSAEVATSPAEPSLDCWRAHFPVRPCADAVHPELAGLWGEVAPRGGGFSAELLYDGCFVTITYPAGGHWLCGPATYAARSDLGLGEANRTHVRWEGDVLYTVSALHGGEMAWARRVSRPNGEWTLERLGVNGAARPLARFDRPHCIGPREWDLICARRITPRDGDPIEGCEGVPRD